MECGMSCQPVILGSFKNITNEILGRNKDHNERKIKHEGNKINETHSSTIPLIASSFR
jgi:hypothetical protein